jgi:hypothetical protein
MNFLLKFAIVVSLAGSLTSLLIIAYPPGMSGDVFWRKPFIGLVFITICVGGSIAAILPRKCLVTESTHAAQTVSASSVRNEFSAVLKGHHPACGRFSAHTIQFRGVSRCAACTGLLVGGAVGIVVAIAYFSIGFGFGQLTVPVVLLGQLAVAIGFVQFKFKSWVRLGANVLFVLGSTLTLTGLDELAGSLFVDLYLIGMIMFWIMTRMLISQWDHSKICSACGFSCRNERKKDVLVSSPQAV